ncbi:AhpC/TSA antioxidant enzyme-domain-containing protein [Phlebopus sp. FC_14]|nr:AhpC/TSA antioxidant enzyme-domain-containing protein [Phlebopus sp. FC_14]
MSGEKHNLPDETSLAQAAQTTVFNSNGERVEFGSIISAKPTIVVFIRHFFCGDYVAQLSAVRPEALANVDRQLVIIGCGSHQPIAHYQETTSCPFPIYADPDRTLYHALGMTIESLARTPVNEERPSYLRKSDFSNALSSIWRGPLKNPSLIGKQGNISQLGGEFVFGLGPTCTYASRMQHTQDHVEVADLMRAAGVEYP